MQISKKISLILKLAIILLALWFIYEKVFANENLLEMKSWFLTTLSQQSSTPLYFVFFLMFLNWGLDALKWKYLIRKIEKVSLGLAFKAVFLGITVSVFTPNRIGEFGGRVFCLKKADRIKAIVITVLGNLGQLLVTLVFGTSAFIYYTYNYYSFFDGKPDYWFFVLLFLGCSLIICLVSLYLNISILSNFFLKFNILKKYKKYSDVFSYYSIKELFNVFFMSMLRYLVFTFQFYILLIFFQVDISFLDSAVMSSMTFLTMTIIPTIALTEIGVRGSAAIAFFGLLSANHLGILTAAFSLWLINLVFPALIGMAFVYKLKFFRSL